MNIKKPLFSTVLVSTVVEKKKAFHLFACSIQHNSTFSLSDQSAGFYESPRRKRGGLLRSLSAARRKLAFRHMATGKSNFGKAFIRVEAHASQPLQSSEYKLDGEREASAHSSQHVLLCLFYRYPFRNSCRIPALLQFPLHSIWQKIDFANIETRGGNILYS